LRRAVDDQVVEAHIDIAPPLEARRRIGAAAPLEYQDTSLRAGVAQVSSRKNDEAKPVPTTIAA
jgi:hypothetical protein